MEPVFLAQIMMFGGNFAPRGWLFCEGQLLSIAQHQALFSILGTTYGGDGRTTFALPDLRGRVGVHPGAGPGLSTWKLGERRGSDTNTLNVLNLPPHSHSLATGTGTAAIGVNQEEPSTDEAAGHVLGSTDGNIVYNNSAADGTLANGSPVNLGGTSGNVGNSQAVNNIKPTLGLNYIIALEGPYPSRS